MSTADDESSPSSRPSHYFDASPQAQSRPRTITLQLPDMHLHLTADTSVFSGQRVDPGTEFLLREAPPPPQAGNILDLGCGYGPIAIALARRAPRATIWAVDINERALQLVADNAHACHLTNLVASRPDDVPQETTFTAIYSNPPVRIGKEPLHGMLQRWLPLCTGFAYMVVQKNLGADSLATWLNATGYHTTRLGSHRGYRLLQVACSLG